MRMIRSIASGVVTTAFGPGPGTGCESCELRPAGPMPSIRLGRVRVSPVDSELHLTAQHVERPRRRNGGGAGRSRRPMAGRCFRRRRIPSALPGSTQPTDSSARSVVDGFVVVGVITTVAAWKPSVFVVPTIL